MRIIKYKLKSVIAVITAMILCISIFPISSLIANAQTQEKYIIFNADSDLLQTKLDGIVTATLTSIGTKYSTVKKYDKVGSYFSTEFSVSGKGGSENNAIFASGVTNEVNGYGWIGNNAFLKKIYKYLTIEFDYRITATKELPADAKLNMSAAGPTKAEICNFGSVDLSDSTEWNTAELSINNTFSLAWQEGFINIYLSSSSGKLSGKQTVDIRRIRITVKEEDRLDFNKALKLASFSKIENFSKDVELLLDDNENKDYFSLITKIDKNCYLSTSTDADYHRIKLIDAADASVAFSATREQVGKNVNIYFALPVIKKIDKITVLTTSGKEITVNQSVENKRYSFVMPDEDITVSITTARLENIKANLLWYVNPTTITTNQWYTGVSSAPYTKQLILDNDIPAWKYSVTNAKGSITIYGTKNRSYELSDFYEQAYLVIDVRLETESEEQILSIGGSSGTQKQITVSDEWTTVSVPFKEVSSTANLSYMTVGLSNLTVGDNIYIGEISIWTKEIDDIRAGFDEMLDISHYNKAETNTLLQVIGDTEANTDPWNEIDMSNPVIQWDRALHEYFQNVPAWSLSPVEENVGKTYNLTFYSGKKPYEFKDEGLMEFLDTGYIEFFIKTSTDGLVLPLVVQTTDGGRKYVPVHVKYDKSKAREDGYMCVRIPFTYLYNLGLNMNQKGFSYIGIKGTMPLKDLVYLSSFRVYSNYADVPDPEPLPEPEVIPERDLPLELDTSIINAVLDKENKIIYIPQNTQIWELLAAITLDTNESYIDFFYDDDFISDEMTVLNEYVTMLIYRRDFYLDSFAIEYLKTEVPVKNTVPTPPVVQDIVVDQIIDSTQNSDSEAEKGTETDTDTNNVTKPKDEESNIKTDKIEDSDNEFPLITVIIVLVSILVIAVGIIILVLYKKRLIKKKGEI